MPRAQKATSNAAAGQVAEQQPAKGAARARGTTTKRATDTQATEKAVAEKPVAEKPVAEKPAAAAKAAPAAGKAAATRAATAKAPAATKAPAVTKAPAAKAPAAKATAAKKGGSTRSGSASDPRAAFLERQRELLLAERTTYTSQAAELKAQADSLALEHEPGDVQFDEEGGEGGTSNVDRELDLILSGQALAAITEIDLALAKISAGTYGICEQCGKEIPEPRLEALPHASLCVSCKSGGLSSRR